MKCNLSEVFRTLQGEGLHTGVPSVFIRFSGCNLRCRWQNPDGTETRCDTPYASWEAEDNPSTVDDVVAVVQSMIVPGDDIVITGGEPTLQHEAVNAILEKLSGHVVTIETNGTNPVRLPDVAILSISPKLEFTGNSRFNDQEYAERVRALIALNPRAWVQLKYVVSNCEEVDRITAFHALIEGPNVVPMLMPQGITNEQLNSRLLWLAETCKRLGWRLTDRQHVRIWGGAKRGV